MLRADCFRGFSFKLSTLVLYHCCAVCVRTKFIRSIAFRFYFILFYVFDMLFKINVQWSEQSHIYTHRPIQQRNTKSRNKIEIIVQHYKHKPECNWSKRTLYNWIEGQGLSRDFEFWFRYKYFPLKFYCVRIFIRMHVFNSQRPSSNDSSKCFGMSAANSQELNENTQTHTHTNTQISIGQHSIRHLTQIYKIYIPWCIVWICGK